MLGSLSQVKTPDPVRRDTEAMRKPAPATLILIVFWTVYALFAAWAVYNAAPLLSRDLLLILGAYAAITVVLSGAILLRVRFTRSRHG